MSATITKLPTARKSYITVRKAGECWNIVLVTPTPVKDFKTTLYSVSEKTVAHDMAKKTAMRQQLPYMGGARS